MSADKFSEAFCRFVRENIDSVEQIRILTLLIDQPDHVWNAESLNAELGTSTHSIDLRLRTLLKKKLVIGSENDGFKYRADPKHDALVRELCDQFEQRPVSVISLIYSSGLESFSDAFRIGGNEHEDG